MVFSADVNTSYVAEMAADDAGQDAHVVASALAIAILLQARMIASEGRNHV